MTRRLVPLDLSRITHAPGSMMAEARHVMDATGCTGQTAIFVYSLLRAPGETVPDDQIYRDLGETVIDVPDNLAWLAKRTRTKLPPNWLIERTLNEGYRLHLSQAATAEDPAPVALDRSKLTWRAEEAAAGLCHVMDVTGLTGKPAVLIYALLRRPGETLAH